MSGALPGSSTLTDSSAVVGNVIALIPPNLQLLCYIDQDLHGLFQARGYRNETYRFCTAPGHHLRMKASGDNKLPRDGTVSCPRAFLQGFLMEITGKRKVGIIA